MTGFGVGEASLAETARLSIEIRAVNHRYLDVHVRAPSALADLALTVETLARERLTRGRFDVSVRIDGAALGAVTVHKAEIERMREQVQNVE